MSEPSDAILLSGNMPANRLTPDAGLRQVARQAAANLEAVKALSDDYLAALTASLADRADLRARVEAVTAAQTAATAAANAATTAATNATAAAATAKNAADAAKTVADKVAADFAAFMARRARTAPPVTVPAMLSLLNGAANVDVTVTWTTPWPDVSYEVVPVLDVPSSLLGKTSVTVKSKALASAVLTVTTSAILASSTSTVRAIAVSST